MKYPSIILSLACTALLAACSSPAANPQPQPNPQPAPDTTQPTIAAVSPVGGSSAATALEVSASDAGGIQKVEFWQGSAPAGKASTQMAEEQVQLLTTDTSAPYRLEFSSTNNGTRNYHVRVFDVVDNVTVSQTLSLTVNIAPPVTQPQPDTEAPTVSTLGIFLSNGTSGNDMVVAPGVIYTLQATATDNVGVTKVEFYRRDNDPSAASIWTKIGEDTTAPFNLENSESCARLSGQNSNTYSAVAFDAAGNASARSGLATARFSCNK